MHRVVPELILENYRAGRFHGEFPSVGMFLDLTGFSSMTDTLMQQGQHGAEVLANLMHGVFNPLVENIFNYGGKIVSFAGDGIMALFPVELGDEKNTAMRALASAWTIQHKLLENPVRQTVYGDFTFSVKIGVTTGLVSWGILRSTDLRDATYYFRGSAVDDSARAEHAARPGEVMLTENIQWLLSDVITSEPLASFHRFGGFVTKLPDPASSAFPPADLEISKLFVPEEIIVQNIRGEFRQIVNLFMRFPDLSDEKLQDCIQIVFALREKYGGLVTRLDFGDKGCNMLILWGAPVAYENDIGRALNFVSDLKARVDFPITAGVTYYVAHAGYLGSPMCEDYTCYGWGVNLASRFMMNAADGEVWVDERIARRVKNRFDFDYLGAQHFKGFAAEQKVFQFSGRKAQEVFHQGELVGRKVELQRLAEWIQPVWQGRFADISVIWGDAGIGKSRLIYELYGAHLTERKNVRWALCHTDQILRHSFNPFRYWLFRYFAVDWRSDDAAQKQAFEVRLNELINKTIDPELASELDRVRTGLGALLDLYWADSFYERLDAEGRYNITVAALIALVKAESLQQPLVIFLEDAQFLDEDTKAFLPRLKRALTAGIVEYPVAILISSRHLGAETVLTPDLVKHSIQLSPLSTQALATLAEVYLGGPAAPDLIKLLETRSEGNPYFAEQILIYLQEERLLEMSSHGWKTIRQMRESSLPADIRALLVARLDQLTRSVREVIHTAAVLGREFEIHVLAEMLQDNLHLPAEITAAERAEIWSAVSQIRYIFTHGLLRDAAYAMQMRARRIELHGIALSALEKVYQSEVEHRYGELAFHAERANLTDKALHYLRYAGQAAAQEYQNSLAVDYLTRALVLVASEDVVVRFEILTKRVELFTRMGQRELQFADLNTLQGLVGQLSSSTSSATLMLLWAHYYFTTGDYLQSVEYCKQTVSYLSPQTEIELSVRLQSYWAAALLRIGQLQNAMAQALKGLQLARQAELRVDEAKILTVLGLIALEQKDPEQSYNFLSESVAIAQAMKERKLEAYALSNLAISEASVNGNYKLAMEYYKEAYKIARELGDRYSECINLVNLGFAAGLQGDIAMAYHYYENSLSAAREIGNLNVEVYTLINLSALSGVQQKVDEALRYAGQADELARKLYDRSAEAWSLLYTGDAYLLAANFPAAREAFLQSLAIRNELEQPQLAMEPLAGLVEAAVALHEFEAGLVEVEKILAYLANGGVLSGADEPLRVYYACYQLLDQMQDPRTQQVLQAANQMLEAQVSKFDDEQVRTSFIENFPWRRALYNAARS